MAKTKAEKAELVQKLEDAFKNATSTVLLHFRGVSVADESALRRELREQNVKYFVAKKTLVRRALTNLGHAHENVPLDGELAVAYGGGEDATAPARLIYEAGKRLADKLVILGGIFGGQLKGQAEMQEIATIPSVPVLRGMFVNVINSPIQGMAIVLKAIADKKQA
jgi:large subunit ribosomal protein L10